jgi:hypothetical protein
MDSPNNGEGFSVEKPGRYTEQAETVIPRINNIIRPSRQNT